MIRGPPVDPFQILQHPRQYLFLGHRVEEGWMKLQLAPVHFLDHLATFLFRQQPPAIERVNQNLLFMVSEFDDKVAGQSDSQDLQFDPPRDLDKENRERYRDSCPAVNHVIEKTVARVEIFLDIAAEPQFAEEQVAQEKYSREGVGVKTTAQSGHFGEGIDLIEILLDVETRVFLSRDEQSRSIQFQIAFISRGHFGEFRAGFFFRHQYTCTGVPTGVESKNAFAAYIGMRMHP